MRRSTQHNESIKTRKQSIQRLEKDKDDDTVVDKCKNLEFTKRPGVNNKKTQIKLIAWWCVFECHPVLSRANLQSVAVRWSVTWFDAIEHYGIPRVRIA